ncbi:MAG: TonB-dependent receptor, partial [Acidobacteria bacterium]|nr:TonB-dependent receptor [Acidobacteriota bacterium]
QSDALSGNSIASALLGAPNSGQARFPAQTYQSYKYLAPYFQDDWKVTRRLSLNLGLRYDFLVPPTERFDRTTAGFDATSANSASKLIDRVKFPDVSVLTGGLLFAGVNGQPRRATNMYWGALQPRFGLAYRVKDRLVFRGGWGRIYLNIGNGQIQPTGFSYTNTMTASNDGGQTPVPGSLKNPFPNGTRLPFGASLGDQSFLGSGFTYSNRGFTPGYMDSFSAGFQVRLPMGSYVEATYVGTRGRDIESSAGINNIPLSVRKQCDYYEGATSQALCNTNVPNPFLGLAPWFGSSLYSSTQIQRSQLLQAFPAFGGITENTRNDTRSWYNALQITAETRKKGGLNLIFTFTAAKYMSQSGYNDFVQGIMQRGLDGGDIPWRSTMGGVYTLPFGKGKKWLSARNSIVNRAVSGWELGWIGQWSAGTPVAIPTGLYVRDARIPGVDWGAERVSMLRPCVAQWNTNNTITLQPFSVAAGCTDYNFLILPAYAPRQAPNVFPNIRGYSFPNLDLSLSKSTVITERMRLHTRADAYNSSNSVGRAGVATGTTDTNFGSALKSNSRGDTYRTIQFSLKLVF